MPVELTVKARYQTDPDLLFEQACDFSDMLTATRLLSSYEGLQPVKMQEGETYHANIRVLRFIRYFGHQIKVDRIDRPNRVMESREFNDKVRSWRHRLEILPETTGALWVDKVEIDAGKRTFVVSNYARLMYLLRHRHRCGKDIASSLKRIA